jgi:hypothetical protein
MSKIIAISGKAQSGKDTLSNFLHGYELVRNDVITKYFISKDGQLVVDVGNDEMGIVNLNKKTAEFVSYAENYIYPFVKKFSMADSLKEIVSGLFHVDINDLYGTNEDKNKKTNLRWENMPSVVTPETCKTDMAHAGVGKDGFSLDDYKKYIKKELGLTFHEAGKMTVREVLQFFGTDIMRKMYLNVWIDNCVERISASSSELSIISDCRFVDELETLKEKGAFLVRLLRNPLNQSHDSENNCDNYLKYDLVIDNREMTIHESCDALMKGLFDNNVISPAEGMNKQQVKV